MTATMTMTPESPPAPPPAGGTPPAGGAQPAGTPPPAGGAPPTGLPPPLRLKGDEAERLLDAVRFNADGLAAAIAQQYDSGEVLMQAWMNREAARLTLTSGQAWYWSRSRRQLWRKGATSGHTQTVVEVRLDCDGDCLLLAVAQKGVACHTGRRSCLFRRPQGGHWQASDNLPAGAPLARRA